MYYYVIGFFILILICLLINLFFYFLKYVPTVCISCKKLNIKQYWEEEQPGYGILITYTCPSCGHKKIEFIK